MTTNRREIEQEQASDHWRNNNGEEQYLALRANRVDGTGGAGDAVPERGGNASAVVAGRGGSRQRDTRRGGGEEERGAAAAEHCSADCVV